MENKQPGDELFDRLNVSISLNSLLKDFDWFQMIETTLCADYFLNDYWRILIEVYAKKKKKR